MVSRTTKVAKLCPMDTNPVSAFNLNSSNLNPDVEIAKAVELGLLPAQALVATAKLTSELENPIMITDPGSGVQFEVLHLNRHSQERPIVMTLSWSVDLTHSGVLNEARLVAIYTKRPVWVIANPNTGASHKLDREMRRVTKKTGFEIIAYCILRALAAEGITEVDFEGTSMGGLLAAYLAAFAYFHDIAVHSLVIVDSPGMIRYKNIVSLVKAFASEKPNLERYNELTSCVSQADQADPESLLDAVKYYIELAKHGLRTNFFIYPRAMSKGNLENCLKVAIFRQSAMKVTLICGTASAISHSHRVIEMYGTLNKNLITRDKVRLNILPGDTHALGAGNRIAWYITKALR